MKDQKPGNSGGHAAIYVKGLCLDPEYNYPRLKKCEPSPEDLPRMEKDPNWGVGVSLDYDFRNVSWVATPGQDFFWNGGVKEGEILDKERLETVLKDAIDLNIFKGVSLHKEYLPRGE